MTAAILVKPNSYAIGPSLHDFAREKWEEQERKREAREAAFDKEFEWWRINHYCDRERPNAKAEIAEVMSAALSDLYNDEKDSAAFDQALFAWFCSKDNVETTNAIYELLDKHIRNAVRKEWNGERQIAA